MGFILLDNVVWIGKIVFSGVGDVGGLKDLLEPALFDPSLDLVKVLEIIGIFNDKIQDILFVDLIANGIILKMPF